MTKIQIAGAGFIKVDAVYGKQYAELDGPDWPKTYQSSVYEGHTLHLLIQAKCKTILESIVVKELLKLTKH